MTSYASSLSFCLQAAGAPEEICSPPFLECLTTLPFGRTYAEHSPRQPGRFIPAGPSVDTHEGINFALKMIGWSAFEWHAPDEQNDAEAASEAISIIREGAERFGPLLIGPLDSSLLPDSAVEPGGFSEYAVYAGRNSGGDEVVNGTPIILDDLLPAWQADHTEGRRGRYGLRARFEARDTVTRATAIARAVPLIRAKLTIDPKGERYWGAQGPRVYAGGDAFRRLALDLTQFLLAELTTTVFAPRTFEFAANQAEQASQFLQEAFKPRAAANMSYQKAALEELAALVAGDAPWNANSASATANRLADAEDSLHDELR